MGRNPRNPYPHARKFRRQGNKEMRRKSANARNINIPRQLYQYKMFERKSYGRRKIIPLNDQSDEDFGCEERVQRKLREEDEQ